MKTTQAAATAIGGIAILLWASFALLTVGAHGLPPFQLLSLSFGVAFVLGLGVQAFRGRAALREMVQAPAPFLTAFCGIFIYHALYFYAFSVVPAMQASLLNYLWPLLFVLFGAAVPGAAGLRPAHLAGALLGLLGTALLLLDRSGDTGGIGAASGYAAAAAAAVVWAGYSVLNRRFAGVPSGMLVGVCGAVSVAGALCHLAFEPATVMPDARQWLSILALGLGPNGLAFFAWDHATKHGNPPVLGAASYAIPLASTVLLAATGAAPLTNTVFVAALLIVSGAVLAAFGTGRGLDRRRAPQSRDA